MRVLLVEDDSTLARLIRRHLESELYVVDLACSLQAARQKFANGIGCDVVILDLMLPDGSGIDFCRELRDLNIMSPVLMLTSKSSTVDKISGLDAGADDYIPKPFSPSELSARLRAVLRRPAATYSEVLSCGDLLVNMTSHTVRVNDQPITLMPKEYSLLEYLMRRKNEVVKREELLRHVWGIYSNTGSNRLEVYMSYLREKLNQQLTNTRLKTIRGLGYMIADE